MKFMPRFQKNPMMMDRKIYLVFAIVVLIAVSNAIISAITIRNSKKIVYDISLVTSPTLEKLGEMNLLVTRSRMLVTNWVYLPDNQRDKDSLTALNYRIYPKLRSDLLHLMRQWPANSARLQMMRLLHDYEGLVTYEEKITRSLVTFDDYRDPLKRFLAEELIENEIIPSSNALMLQLKQLIAEKKAEASEMQDRMIASYFYLLVMVLGLAVIIIVSVLMAGGYMQRKVIGPIMKIRGVIMQMSRGELPDFTVRASYNALGEMSYAIRQLIGGLKRTAHFAGEIGRGNLNTPFIPLSENDVFGSALLEMQSRLAAASETDAALNWKNQAAADLGQILHRSFDTVDQLAEALISGLVACVEAQQGAIYLVEKNSSGSSAICLSGYYGLHARMTRQKLEMKEGLVGQAISNNKIIHLPQVRDPEYRIESGLMTAVICDVYIVPLYAGGKVLGALEIVTTGSLSEVKRSFVESFAGPVATGIISLQSNLLTKKLLTESQQQAEELAMQDLELRQINEELTAQSKLLRLSEDELKAQQDELRIANMELHAKAVLLEEKNLTIEEARQSIVFKAEQLERSNKYKSAFLANMSHELRTPLNSVLILARLLADNKDKNLTGKQLEYAKVIHKSGSDLLLLINDILDLSKIESGKIDLVPEDVSCSNMIADLHILFRELASEKGIEFNVEIAHDVPATIFTDRMRLDQILKNLLSNAFKFTPREGSVILRMALASPDLIFRNQQLFAAEKVISISVRDTGIGIHPDKQQVIFEAFKQADGSTTRRFGGTGLGLAISKELAQMLGGDLALISSEGKGSTFTLYMPETLAAAAEETDQNGLADKSNERRPGDMQDDRHSIVPGEKCILIIEDDPAFCKTLTGIARQHRIKVIATMQGDTGIQYASRYRPDAILLDMQIPVIDGWTVLKKLKEDTALQRIPVYVFSAVDKKKLGMEMGAAGYFVKPPQLHEIQQVFESVVSSNIHERKILLVENRSAEVEKILHLIREKEKNSAVESVTDIHSCIRNMQMEKYDSILVCASIADDPANLSLVNSMEKAASAGGITLSVYEDDPAVLRERGGNPMAEIPLASLPISVPQPDPIQQLKGSKVLLADDDMRNVYALTTVLEAAGMQVICAYDGSEAIDRLESNPDISIVLMNMVMPVMDGMETIRVIRERDSWSSLPVIAFSSRASAAERQALLAAGVSAFAGNPGAHVQLLSLIKTWLNTN